MSSIAKLARLKDATHQPGDAGSLEDERMHSPNEFTRLANFERGQIVYVQLLKQFGEMEPASLIPI